MRHASQGSRLPTESDSGVEGDSISESEELPPPPPEGASDGSRYPSLQSAREVTDSNRSLSARNLLQHQSSARSCSIRDTAGSLVTAGV